MIRIKCLKCGQTSIDSDIYTKDHDHREHVFCPVCGYDIIGNYEGETLFPGVILEGKNKTYEINGLINSGGFSHIYKVLASDGKNYAMKELYPSEFITPRNNCKKLSIDWYRREQEQKTLFEKEFEKIKILDDKSTEGIVRVHEIIDNFNTKYIVMDYLNGKSLKETIQQERFDLKTALVYLKPIQHALEVCRQLGYVHCDVNPNNIQVLSDHQCVLLDFGIAKSREDRTTFAQTEYYAPPNDEKRTHAYDVYGFAATFYYCITGRDPNIYGETFQWPSELNIVISPYQEKVLKNALQPDAGRRTQTVVEFYDNMHRRYDPKTVNQIKLFCTAISLLVLMAIGGMTKVRMDQKAKLITLAESLNPIEAESYFCGQWIANASLGRQYTAVVTLREDGQYFFDVFSGGMKEGECVGKPVFRRAGFYEVEEQYDKHHMLLHMFDDSLAYEERWSVDCIDGKLIVNPWTEDEESVEYYGHFEDAMYIPCVKNNSGYKIDFMNPKVLNSICCMLDIPSDPSYEFETSGIYYSNYSGTDVISYTIKSGNVIVAETEISLSYFNLAKKEIRSADRLSENNLIPVSDNLPFLGEWIAQSNEDDCTGVLSFYQDNTFSLKVFYQDIHLGSIPIEHEDIVFGNYHVTEDLGSNSYLLTLFDDSDTTRLACKITVFEGGDFSFQSWLSDMAFYGSLEELIDNEFENALFIPCKTDEYSYYIDYEDPAIVRIVAKQLSIPDDLAYTVIVGEPYRARAAEGERISYSFEINGELIASAIVDAHTLSLARNIYFYTPLS